MASANSGWHCKNCGHSYAASPVSHPGIPQHLLTMNNPLSDAELISILTAIVDLGQELATHKASLIIPNTDDFFWVLLLLHLLLKEVAFCRWNKGKLVRLELGLWQ